MTNMPHPLSYMMDMLYSLRQMNEELDSLKGRVSAAERNVASMDAQRKAAFSDNANAQKQASTFRKSLTMLCLVDWQ